MLIIDVEDKDKRVSKYLGGSYSFLELIRMGGSGSPKIVYKSGISEFDIIAGLNNDSSYCNFEVYKDGVAIRIRKRDKGFVAALQFNEIEKISFLTIPNKVFLYKRYLTRNSGRILIYIDGVQIVFDITSAHYKTFRAFLIKKVKISRIDFETHSIKKDSGSLILEIINNLLN